MSEKGDRSDKTEKILKHLEEIEALMGALTMGGKTYDLDPAKMKEVEKFIKNIHMQEEILRERLLTKNDSSLHQASFTHRVTTKELEKKLDKILKKTAPTLSSDG